MSESVRALIEHTGFYSARLMLDALLMLKDDLVNVLYVTLNCDYFRRSIKLIKICTHESVKNLAQKSGCCLAHFIIKTKRLKQGNTLVESLPVLMQNFPLDMM
jgi:hypothetical protein